MFLGTRISPNRQKTSHFAPQERRSRIKHEEWLHVFHFIVEEDSTLSVSLPESDVVDDIRYMVGEWYKLSRANNLSML